MSTQNNESRIIQEPDFTGSPLPRPEIDGQISDFLEGVKSNSIMVTAWEKRLADELIKKNKSEIGMAISAECLDRVFRLIGTSFEDINSVDDVLLAATKIREFINGESWVDEERK